jgi:Leucine-rich repeat (LRR) protein
LEGPIGQAFADKYLGARIISFCDPQSVRMLAMTCSALKENLGNIRADQLRLLLGDPEVGKWLSKIGYRCPDHITNENALKEVAELTACIQGLLKVLSSPGRVEDILFHKTKLLSWLKLGYRRNLWRAFQQLRPIVPNNARNLDRLEEGIDTWLSLPDRSHTSVLFRPSLPLSCIPEELSRLDELIELSIPRGYVRSVPPCIGNLKNVQWIDLSNNALSDLPNELGELSRLKRLDIRNNKFTTLPPVISALRARGVNVIIEGNPLNFSTRLREKFFWVRKVARDVACFVREHFKAILLWTAGISIFFVGFVTLAKYFPEEVEIFLLLLRLMTLRA